MSFSPLVSIALLCYNHEKYISKAIESVLEQTYKNIELIVVDNSSTDNSKEIIKSIIHGDSRVSLIELTENTFVSYGWNYAAKLCKGEYIVSLSGDDYFDKYKIEKQLDFMLKNNLTNSFTWVNCVNDSEEVINNHSLEKLFNRNFNFLSLIKILLTEGNTLCATSFMFHRSIFKKYGYYDNRLIQSQDYDLWLRIIKYEEIFVLTEKLTNYRVRDDGKNLSINMSENSIKRSIFESIYFLKVITEFDVKILSLSIEEECDENNKYLKLFEYFIKKEKNIYATAMLLSMFDKLENDSQFLLGNYKSFYEVYSNYDLLNIIEVNKLREEINRKDLQIIELNNLVKSYKKLSYKELLKILIKKIFNFKDN